MRDRMKSYLVFAGARYRLAVYLLMPAVLLGIGLWVEGKLGSGNGGVGAIVVTVLLPMAEISSDNWLFGGIQAKDSMGLEYLKASGRGMGILKNALWMDLARKFLSALGIIALHRLAAALAWGWEAGGAPGSRPGIAHSWPGNAGSAVGVLLYFVLVAYIVSALGTFLSRFGDMFWMNLLISYGAVFLAAFALMLLNLAEHIFIIDIMCMALGVAVSVLTVQVAMKRVERSYYDK
nr:hypothetical protein [uncultured Acetatifactor sp.]